MSNLLATVVAGLVVVLFGAALLAMTAENFQVAGFAFLSASLLIYIRETRLVE